MQEGERTEDGMSGLRTSDTLERLSSVVREHRVCWEVLPEEVPGQDNESIKIRGSYAACWS